MVLEVRDAFISKFIRISLLLFMAFELKHKNPAPHLCLEDIMGPISIFCVNVFKSADVHFHSIGLFLKIF